MDLEIALRGMEDAKSQLRSTDGVNIPSFMSEHMDRLAIYTNAVEDHLAEAEAELERSEAVSFTGAVVSGMSASAAEKQAKMLNAKSRAMAKELSRKVASAWRLIDEKRSRFNHLTKEAQGQI